ncbi:FtsX-like permease family protein [Natronospora cellulosivora (SeqCode)]
MSFFTVIWMVLKQIKKNWKLECILLFGLVLAVAVSSTIIIYTDGVLQSVMVNRWERNMGSNFRPASIRIIDEQSFDYHPLLSETQWRDQDEAYQQYLDLDEYFANNIPDIFNTEILSFSKSGRTDRRAIIPLDSNEARHRRYVNLSFQTGLEDRVEVLGGNWFNEESSDPYIEVVVDENAIHNLDIRLGNIYQFPLETEGDERDRYLDLKVVGVFRIDTHSYNQAVWPDLPPYSDTFFMAEGVFEEVIRREDTRPFQYSWFWNFDHEPVRISQLETMLNSLRRMERGMSNISDRARITNAPVTGLSFLVEEAEQLRMLLLILSLPILGMIFYYIILAASLTIQKRSNEIALFRSRGAGIYQVLFTYLLEWIFISLLALIVGPYLGLFIARIMGAASGFLEFVNREALPVMVPMNTYFYAFLTIAVAVLSCLFLIIPAARESIVSYKQNLARNNKKQFWQRYYLDFILLAFSLYGYRELSRQISVMQRSAYSSDLLLDPMLFLIPVLFIATAGLLSLRIIPYLLRFLTIITEKLPEVSLTVTLRQFFRNPGQYTPLLFFIIMTVSLGIYSSSIARTMDRNYNDSLMYRYGADVVLQERWNFDTDSHAIRGGRNGEDTQVDERVNSDRQTVFEPPFYIHKQLPGVIDAARVMTKRGRVSIGQSIVGNSTLMAIDPVDFANVSWFRDDLTDIHWHYYLNALLKHSSAALVDRDFYEEEQLSIGDWIRFNLGGQDIEIFIAGVIDLWPTVYPNQFPLIVANLNHVQQQYIIEPYQVWLRLEDGAEIQTIVDHLLEENIYVSSVSDTRRKIIENRRDPQRMGLFGILSIGFVVAVLITVLGFFLYNFLSLKNRLLQFGVMRAIGLSLKQLIIMLSLEQFLTVGIGFALGTIFGVIVSRTFLPFLQLSQNLEGVVPGFKIIVDRSDVFNILIIIGGTLIIGLIFLAMILVKLKLHDAIKLGEEV